MAWLSGWDNRIKLTIDHTKVDAALSHFPVTVFLSSTHGDCVFDELIADANRFKIAFTKADGTTQLYGEIEKWDDGNESAIIHVSASGWAISDTEDTIFYMYYDVDHADNTTYIGDIASTPGASVWDSNFKAVYHMVDATTSTILDSTSNNNDGTKTAANNPASATGKIGLGQDFDGDDTINLGADATLDIGAELTYEACVKFDAVDSVRRGILGLCKSVGHVGANIAVEADNKFSFWAMDDLTDGVQSNAIIDTNWTHWAGVRRSGTNYLYRDGVQQTDTEIRAPGNPDINMHIGSFYTDPIQNYMLGLLDEIRISNIGRSAAWIKGTYNSLWDTLLTYGGAELKKQLSEAFSSTDSLVKNGTEQLAEAFSAIDSKITSVSWTLMEAFSIVDSWLPRVHLSEAFSIADSLVKNGIKSLAESFSIIDSWRMVKRFTETLKVIDSIIKKHIIIMKIRKIIIRVRGGSYESDIELED